jgi:hypothetical protein
MSTTRIEGFHFEQRREQSPLTATQIDDALCAEGGDELRHGVHAALVERYASLQLNFLRSRRGGCRGLGFVLCDLLFVRQLLQCCAREASPILEVAARDPFLPRMMREPLGRVAEQFLDLCVANPVVFAVIEHRHEHIQMAQHVLQTCDRAEFQRVVWARAPLRKCLVECVALGVDCVSERLEQRVQQPLAAPARNRRDGDFERNTLLGQFGTMA